MATTMTNYAAERDMMVERQLKRRGITDSAILEAFRVVPREAFIADEYAHLAYGDHPLPIEAGQTISQPYIVALMIQAAAIKAGDSVLEIGSGSGYAAAVISQMGAKLIGVERQHDLVEVARERLHRLGYGDVKIVKGDGTKGCAEGAPFNAILAAASGTHIPGSLLGQLTPDGRIIMPIGSSGWAQQLIKVTKQEDGVLKQENLGAVRFVPLIGEEGWKDA